MRPMGGWRTVLSVSFVLLWLLSGHGYSVNAAARGKGKHRGDWKLKVCNEKKSCVGSTCDVGQICDKVDSPERECYECKNCTNVRKLVGEVKPSGFFELEQECWHIRVKCGPCPDCAPELVKTMAATHLVSNSTNEENNKKAATLMDDPVVFRLFTAFLLSVMVNVFLLSIVIMTCKSSKEFVPSYENEGYEVVMQPRVEKPET